jgi:hypothetical protein
LVDPELALWNIGLESSYGLLTWNIINIARAWAIVSEFHYGIGLKYFGNNCYYPGARKYSFWHLYAGW